MNNRPELVQFPHPTKPIHAQNSLPSHSFQATGQDETSFVVDDDDHQPQNYYYYYYYNYSDEDDEKNHDHKFLKKLYAKVEDKIVSLKTSIKDRDKYVERNKILDLFKKFGAKIHKKLVEHADDHAVIVQERGVVDIEVDQKLERFKVRTVNLGGGGGDEEGDKAADEVPKK